MNNAVLASKPHHFCEHDILPNHLHEIYGSLCLDREFSTSHVQRFAAMSTRFDYVQLVYSQGKTEMHTVKSAQH
jgi:hypothetical protein